MGWRCWSKIGNELLLGVLAKSAKRSPNTSEVQERVGVEAVQTPTEMIKADDRGRPSPRWIVPRHGVDAVGVIVRSLQPVIAKEALGDAGFVAEQEQLIEHGYAEWDFVQLPKALDHIRGRRGADPAVNAARIGKKWPKVVSELFKRARH